MPEPEPEPEEEEEEEEEDILELTDDMVDEPEEDLPPIDLNYDPEPEPEPAPRMMPRFDPADLVDDVESLLAPPVQAASTSTLAELARAVARERGLGLGNGGLTLEDITREILRALIKDWLDQNLPYMIERIVKKEIEKMVNRAEKL